MSMPARVLVVDDSPTMRGLITAVLNKDPDVSVIGQAGDAHEARAAIKQLNPDVVTLDIEMPNMNGLEFLEKIMRLRPMPVIMVSTMTHQGANATLAALEIGAFDCVSKPVPGDVRPFGDLAEKVKAAARSNRGRVQTTQAPSVSPAAEYRVGRKIVAIGSSTGGVEALITVLQKFPQNCPPTVITQHMPPTFTKSFAERLNRICAPVVQEATDGARLEIGKIYLAPGGDRHLQVVNPSAPSCRHGGRATGRRYGTPPARARPHRRRSAGWRSTGPRRGPTAQPSRPRRRPRASARSGSRAWAGVPAEDDWAPSAASQREGVRHPAAPPALSRTSSAASSSDRIALLVGLNP